MGSRILNINLDETIAQCQSWYTDFRDTTFDVYLPIWLLNYYGMYLEVFRNGLHYLFLMYQYLTENILGCEAMVMETAFIRTLYPLLAGLVMVLFAWALFSCLVSTRRQWNCMRNKKIR